MNERDRLIELLEQHCLLRTDVLDCTASEDVECSACLANHLIANGVTVQGWISVEDRLLEEKCLAICMLSGRPAYKEMLIGWVGKDARCETGYACESDGEILPDVTHWMPLPEPPKGE